MHIFSNIIKYFLISYTTIGEKIYLCTRFKKYFLTMKAMKLFAIAAIAFAAVACGNNAAQEEEIVEEVVEATECTCDSTCTQCDSCTCAQADTTVVAQ